MTLFTASRSPLYVLVMVLLYGKVAQAQTWQSAMKVGNPAALTTEVAAVQTDASGNVYILGAFSNALTLGSTTLTSAGSSDVFVAKWNPATSSFVWAVRAGGSTAETPKALALSGAAIYLTGGYSGANAAFGTTTLPTAGTTNDVFVAKLTDAGSSASFTWAVSGGGTASDIGSTLAALGNTVYVGGVYNSPAMSLGGITLSNAGGQDAFLAKLTDNGPTASFNWVEPLGYNSATTDVISALVASSAGVYMAGYYDYHSAPIGVGLVLYTNFLTKVIDYGSSTSYGWQQAPNMVSALALNGTSLYVAGTFTSTTTFGTTTLSGPPIGPAANGAREVYVAKLVDVGTTSSYAWAKQSSSSTYSTPYISSLAVRGAEVYATGYSNNSTIIFGSASIPAGSFVAKLADAGPTASSAWTLQAAGTSFAPNALATSGTAVYVAGTMGVQASFGNIVLNAAPANAYEPFLATIADVALPTRSAASLADLRLYPNPAHATATVHVPASSSPATLTLLDAVGRIVRVQSAVAGTDTALDLRGLTPGMYTLRVQASEALAVRQLVVQ